MEFICYNKCSTCRKARKWLDDNNVEYVERPIKEDPPSLEEVTKWVEVSNRPIKSFFNTSGTVYRSLNLKDRLPEMSDAEKITLLASDPMLVKRPVVVLKDGTILSGFKENEWKEKLLNE